MPAYAIDGVVPVVHPTAYVHPTAVLIGDVHVGPGCYVGPLASLRGDFGRIVLEVGSNVQDACVLHTFPGTVLTLGPDGHVGHAAVLHGCRVGEGALIGINAVVLDGAVVGEYAFVGAHCLVRAEFVVPPRTLAAGVPAKVVRDLTDTELAWKAHGTAVYQALADRSRDSLRLVDPLAAAEPDRPALPVTTAVPLDQARRASGEPSKRLVES
jgi:phenylacetic acid degradation protein